MLSIASFVISFAILEYTVQRAVHRIYECFLNESLWSSLWSVDVIASKYFIWQGSVLWGWTGVDNSHLVNTFGDLWRTHREGDLLPARQNRNAAQDWCSQPETRLPSQRIGNPRLKSGLASQSRHSTSVILGSQVYQNERALDLGGDAKIFPSNRDEHYENYMPMHGKTVDGLRHVWRQP